MGYRASLQLGLSSITRTYDQMRVLTLLQSFIFPPFTPAFKAWNHSIYAIDLAENERLRNLGFAVDYNLIFQFLRDGVPVLKEEFGKLGEIWKESLVVKG